MYHKCHKFFSLAVYILNTQTHTHKRMKLLQTRNKLESKSKFTRIFFFFFFFFLPSEIQSNVSKQTNSAVNKV